MKTYSIYAVVLSVLITACATPGSAEKADAARSRLQIAETMFRERCKTAGEKIHKTVENVEGIFLMKVRPREINYEDQFAMTDPYGDDLGGSGYIGSFLRGEYQATHKGTSAPGSPPRRGYLYVDAIDPKEGKRYRYVGSVKAVGKMDATAANVKVDLKRNPNFDLNIYAFVLDRTPATGPMPRYGVTYDDISTREEREYWIAGSSLRVIDMQTKDVIAERIGYMMDRGQGKTSGGRSPWLLAANNACPSFQRNPLLSLPPGQGAAAQSYQALDFVEKILKPTGIK
jgi:hypothetical protein